MSLTYKRITSGEVPPELVRAANEAAQEAARDLGLGKLRVQWIKPSPDDPTGGWHDERWPNVIHISVDLAKEIGPDQVRAVVFHEARHAWQLKTMRYYGYGQAGKREDDANQYAYRKTRIVLNTANWFDNREYYK